MANSLYYCIDVKASKNISNDLKLMNSYGFDYLVSPLCYVNGLDKPLKSIKNDPLLRQSEWNKVIGKLTNNLKLTSNISDNDYIFQIEDYLQKEFEWAKHIGIRNIILPSIVNIYNHRHEYYPNHMEMYARFVNHLVKSIVFNTEVLIPLPLVHFSSNSNHASQEYNSIKYWNIFKNMTNHNVHIGCIVDISEDTQDFDDEEENDDLDMLYESVSDASNSKNKQSTYVPKILRHIQNEMKMLHKHEKHTTAPAADTSSRSLELDEVYDYLRRYVDKWGGEYVRGVQLSLNMFVLNELGFPVFRKCHQIVLAVLLQYCSVVYVKGMDLSVELNVDSECAQDSSDLYLPYRQYIDHINSTKYDIIRSTHLKVDHRSASGTGHSDSLAAGTDASIGILSKKRKLCPSQDHQTIDDHLSISPRITEHLYDIHKINEEVTSSYRDALQLPLQPLTDNLDFNTYEIFERDPTKYAQYELAIEFALMDLYRNRQEIVENMGLNFKKEQIVNGVDLTRLRVAVVGAGRGPLVACALRAAKKCGISIELFAIEKNNNAIMTLNTMKELHQWDVEIMECDMREWVPPPPHADYGVIYKPYEYDTNTTNSDCISGDADMKNRPLSGLNTIDLVISELLGSWGDNELSPECLEHCIARCLKNEFRFQWKGCLSKDAFDHLSSAPSPVSMGGISIPQSYTSYCTPISTSKLYMAARDVAIPPHTSQSVSEPNKGLNTPFVCKLHSYTYLSKEILPLFTFEHYSKCLTLEVASGEHSDSKLKHRIKFPMTCAAIGDDTVMGSPNYRFSNIHDNKKHRRYQSQTFNIESIYDGMTIHGFAGYFESKLYKHVNISIRPDTHTPEMFSWFPVYLPIETPILISCRKVQINIWRCVDSMKIWYEWNLTLPIVTKVQNSEGESYSISLL